MHFSDDKPKQCDCCKDMIYPGSYYFTGTNRSIVCDDFYCKVGLYKTEYKKDIVKRVVDNNQMIVCEGCGESLNINDEYYEFDGYAWCNEDCMDVYIAEFCDTALSKNYLYQADDYANEYGDIVRSF